MSGGTPPDMEITAYDKIRGTGAKVGVGWTQDDGSIALVLNPGTALVYQANVSYKVKKKVAAPTEAAAPASTPFQPTRAEWKPPARVRHPMSPAKSLDSFDDDIPF